jgi:hypothetical protein
MKIEQTTTLMLIVLLLTATGCVTMKVDPIHITMDINVRVTQEVEKFFDEIDDASSALVDDLESLPQ